MGSSAWDCISAINKLYLFPLFILPEGWGWEIARERVCVWEREIFHPHQLMQQPCKLKKKSLFSRIKIFKCVWGWNRITESACMKKQKGKTFLSLTDEPTESSENSEQAGKICVCVVTTRAFPYFQNHNFVYIRKMNFKHSAHTTHKKVQYCLTFGSLACFHSLSLTLSLVLSVSCIRIPSNSNKNIFTSTI